MTASASAPSVTVLEGPPLTCQPRFLIPRHLTSELAQSPVDSLSPVRSACT